VISAAREDSDPRASAVMAEIGRSVGHLLAILSPIFFPQRIVITGGTAEAGEAFFQAIRDRYHKLIGPFMTSLAELATGTPRQVEIVKGRLGPDAAILGAVAGFFPSEEPDPGPGSTT
jgi:predicted NBD/HSP70 family sugar kinase